MFNTYQSETILGSLMVGLIKAGITFFLLSTLVIAAEKRQSGIVEKMAQDDGFITISGKSLAYSDSFTRVFLRGTQVGSEVMDIGMTVRYTLTPTGGLAKIDLIGPLEKLRILEKN